MRIIAGKLGGRNFQSPKNSRTHPMSDKARGGLFNALGDINGLSVLDAFAGSGALSFEAISRGASSALAIDIDKGAVTEIDKSIKELGIKTQVKAIRANASGWSDNNLGKTFDIVIAAPPYDDLQEPLVNKLVRHAKKGGLFILDWPAKTPTPEFQDITEIAHHNYGDAELFFYRA